MLLMWRWSKSGWQPIASNCSDQLFTLRLQVLHLGLQRWLCSSPCWKIPVSSWSSSVCRERFGNNCCIIYKHRLPTCCNQSHLLLIQNSWVAMKMSVLKGTNLPSLLDFPASPTVCFIQTDSRPTCCCLVAVLTPKFLLKIATDCEWWQTWSQWEW